MSLLEDLQLGSLRMEGDACYICCATEKDLRPYGKNMQMVCFECAMKDKAETEAQFVSQMNAAGSTPVIGTEFGPVPPESLLLDIDGDER